VFAPCLAWNARHGWASIGFQLGHGFASNATLRSFGEYLAGQLLGAGPVQLALGALFLARARTSAAKRVATAALLPLAVTTWAALRGKVEANWPALAYPALSAAAAAWLCRPGRRAPAQALARGSAALAVLLLALFGAEQRSPRLLAGTAAIERFHGWRALAREARALSAQACAQAGCDPAQPFLVASSYQVAAELAYYGGFERLGPAVERRSQLDLWGERPRPGEPFLFVGSDGPRELRALGQALGEGATGRAAVEFGGVRLRDVTVTPFARYPRAP
jgi:hypothetical protein